MKQNLLLKALGILLLMLVIPVSYSGDEETPSTLPDYYPVNFPKQGVLTEIRSQYHWVVNGVQINVSQNVLVHTLASNFSSLYYITLGMELGYRKNASGEIEELWELPSGTIDGE